VDMSGLRWTIDYPDDLELIRRIIERVRKPAVEADRFDFLRVVSVDPSLSGARHARNEGYLKSLAEDAKH